MHQSWKCNVWLFLWLFQSTPSSLHKLKELQSFQHFSKKKVCKSLRLVFCKSIVNYSDTAKLFMQDWPWPSHFRYLLQLLSHLYYSVSPRPCYTCNIIFHALCGLSLDSTNFVNISKNFTFKFLSTLSHLKFLRANLIGDTKFLSSNASLL